MIKLRYVILVISENVLKAPKIKKIKSEKVKYRQGKYYDKK